MALGARAILAAADAGHYPIDNAVATAAALALSVRQSVGGTSGALYEIFLSAAAGSLKVRVAAKEQHPTCHMGSALQQSFSYFLP